MNNTPPDMPQKIWHKIDNNGIVHTSWEEIDGAIEYLRSDIVIKAAREDTDAGAGHQSMATSPTPKTDAASEALEYLDGKHYHAQDFMKAFGETVRHALKQAAQAEKLAEMADHICKTFKADFEQGYKSNDKRFVVDLLDKALREYRKVGEG